MKTFFATATALTILCGTAAAQPAVRINELFTNAPGTDNGQEFIELRSAAPSFALTGLTLLVIEGDTTGRGVIDIVLPLGALTTGSNGLLLFRDSAAVLTPAPDAATTLVVQDFNPDIENGANTYVIVRGFTGAAGNDLDTNNDGVLDSTPWAEVVDAVGYQDGDNPATTSQYATQLGGIDISALDPDPNVSFTPDAFARYCQGVVGTDIFGTAPGPYTADPAQNRFFGGATGPLPANWTLTPGAANIEDCGTTCRPDLNNDGELTFDDIQLFVTLYNANDPRADFNNDTEFTFDDIQAFIALFNSGC